LNQRLSLLMFLLYAVPGAWWPVFSLRLRELAFEPVEAGWAFAGCALGATLASLVAGQVADRWLPAERCIVVCGTAAGVLLLVLAEATSPAAVCLLCLASWLMITPTLTLGLTLTMTHLRSPERDFGRVRVWGTAGWVVVSWLLGYWFAAPDWLLPLQQDWLGRDGKAVADSQRLAGVLSFALAAYAMTLPPTPPARGTGSWLAPLGAVHLLRRRAFAVLCLCAFCLHVTFPFTQQMTPLLLGERGVPLEWIGPTLTLAQAMEVLLLGLLPWIGRSLGLRGTLLLGLVSWATALAVLAAGHPAWLVIGSLLLTGMCVPCYVIRAQVLIGRMARPASRASVQGLFAMLNGCGLLCGNLLVGWVRPEDAGRFGPAFAVGLAIAAAAVVAFIYGFEREGPVSPFSPGEIPPPQASGTASPRAGTPARAAVAHTPRMPV
jgi:MFS family permease